MAEEKKEFQLSLNKPGLIKIFPNFNRKGEQPEFRGIMTDDIGDEYIVSLWEKKGARGGKYLTGRVTRKSDLDSVIKKQDKSKEEGRGTDFDLFND